MNILISLENFQKAVKFLNLKARPLDLALFNNEFVEKNQDRVILELKKYKNHDGGFGHGIEPDIRLRNSSILATTVAFQYFDFARIDPHEKIIEDAINYLVENFNYEEVYWSSTNLDVNDEPHAPWWTKKVICAPKPEDWANPNAEVIGYLNRYSHFVSPDLLNQCNSFLSDHLYRERKLTGFIYYKFLCWKRSLPHFPDPIINKVIKMLNNTFSEISILEETDFAETHVQRLVTEPSSYLNEKFPGFVDMSLMKLISSQATDGGWYPNWEWGSYQEEWKKARTEWAGKITFETLSVLKYFDLIES